LQQRPPSLSLSLSLVGQIAATKVLNSFSVTVIGTKKKGREKGFQQPPHLMAMCGRAGSRRHPSERPVGRNVSI
jgi:hypothetical protein